MNVKIEFSRGKLSGKISDQSNCPFLSYCERQVSTAQPEHFVLRAGLSSVSKSTKDRTVIKINFKVFKALRALESSSIIPLPENFFLYLDAGERSDEKICR